MDQQVFQLQVIKSEALEFECKKKKCCKKFKKNGVSCKKCPKF